MGRTGFQAVRHCPVGVKRGCGSAPSGQNRQAVRASSHCRGMPDHTVTRTGTVTRTTPPTWSTSVPSTPHVHRLRHQTRFLLELAQLGCLGLHIHSPGRDPR